MTQKLKIYKPAEPESNWEVVGENAKIVWDALGIFQIFDASEETWEKVQVKDENIDTFITGMSDKYGIEFAKVYCANYQ